MEVKVITVPFEKDKNGFDGKELEEFVSKVEIVEIKSNFFINGVASGKCGFTTLR